MLVIVNPLSGKAKMKNELMGVCQIFSEGGYDVSVYPTKSRGDATEKTKSLNQGEYEIIVVCGGDGTLNEVITGLMEANLHITIGYIPAGTLNEWSSGLKISRNIKKAAKDIISGQIINLDIGKFGDKYFSYTASFGAFTEASYSAPQNVKNILGQAAYFFEGIKSLGNIKPIHLKFLFDDKEIEGDYLFGAVSNSMSVGGIVKFKENTVKLNDGFFEVVLIKKPTNLAVFQNTIDGILKKDYNREGIEFFHTNSVTVLSDNDLSWTLDGEYAAGTDKLTITNIHSAINLIVPSEDTNQTKLNNDSLT